jgi:hypothetical protein
LVGVKGATRTRRLTTLVAVMAGRGQAGPPLICSGNAIDFRVGRGEAEAIKSVLVGLMLGKHPTQQVPTSTSSPSPPPSP